MLALNIVRRAAVGFNASVCCRDPRQLSVIAPGPSGELSLRSSELTSVVAPCLPIQPLVDSIARVGSVLDCGDRPRRFVLNEGVGKLEQFAVEGCR